jgi:thioredoxin 1
VTASNFEEEVLRWPGIVLLEFWAEQCSICRAIMPFIRELAGRKAGILKVALVNVEREGFLANRFEIRSTPVFIVYQNGVKINELHGALPRQEMEAWIQSALGI